VVRRDEVKYVISISGRAIALTGHGLSVTIPLPPMWCPAANSALLAPSSVEHPNDVAL